MAIPFCTRFRFLQFDSFCVSRTGERLALFFLAVFASHVPDNQAKLTLAISDILVLEVRPPTRLLARIFVAKMSLLVRSPVLHVLQDVQRCVGTRFSRAFRVFSLDKNAMSSRLACFHLGGFLVLGFASFISWLSRTVDDTDLFLFSSEWNYIQLIWIVWSIYKN